MFHTFLNSISDFSGETSTAMGIALPPIAVLSASVAYLAQHPMPGVPLHRQAHTDPSSTSSVLGDWLDNLPVRGWD